MLIQSPFHQFSDSLTQQMLLCIGCLPDRCSKVSAGGYATEGTGHDQNRVVVQVRKRNDVCAPSALQKRQGQAGSPILGYLTGQTRTADLLKLW